MTFPVGGGGGPAASTDASTAHALDKPYDITGEPSADKMQQIDEMFDLLFRSATQTEEDVADAGGVSGPSSSTDGNVPKFDGTDGQTLADSGKAAASLVTGPASVTAAGNVALFDGTSGKAIKDSGGALSVLVPESFVVNRNISEAEIEDWVNNPIQLIPAPGAGKIIKVLSFAFRVNITTAYSTSPTVRLVYQGDTSSLLGTGTITWTTTGEKLRIHEPAQITFTDLSSFDPRNKALMLTASAVPGTPGTGVATGRVSVTYSIGDLP